VNRWTKAEHIGAAFTACPKPCVGGRMTWAWSEPQWRTDLGLVGTCTHCGAEVFTTDILNGVVINQPQPNVQRRSGNIHRRSGIGRGGWNRNDGIFAA
jgi:hypothetical protein